jgi:hypothetical protein
MAANVVAFDMNVPVQLAVKYSSPQLFNTAKGPRARFSCVDGRTLFLDPEVAASIPQMGIRPHEPFNICLRWNGERGQAKRWDIWRTEKGGASASASPAPAPNAVVPEATREAAPGNALLAGAASSISPTPRSIPHSGWALAVREQTQALIDIYSDCCKYASERHGDVVSRDDVRCLMMNRLISGGRR